MCLIRISHLTIAEISLLTLNTKKYLEFMIGFYIPEMASGYGDERLDLRKEPDQDCPEFH